MSQNSQQKHTRKCRTKTSVISHILIFTILYQFSVSVTTSSLRNKNLFVNIPLEISYGNMLYCNHFNKINILDTCKKSQPGPCLKIHYTLLEIINQKLLKLKKLFDNIMTYFAILPYTQILKGLYKVIFMSTVFLFQIQSKGTTS